MNLTEYKVKGIILPNGEYWPDKPVDVIDEGSFYRIDGTYIIDKHKIEQIEEIDGRIEIRMKDSTVVLIVCEKETRK